MKIESEIYPGLAMQVRRKSIRGNHTLAIHDTRIAPTALVVLQLEMSSYDDLHGLI